MTIVPALHFQNDSRYVYRDYLPDGALSAQALKIVDQRLSGAATTMTGDMAIIRLFGEAIVVILLVALSGDLLLLSALLLIGRRHSGKQFVNRAD